MSEVKKEIVNGNEAPIVHGIDSLEAEMNAMNGIPVEVSKKSIKLKGTARVERPVPREPKKKLKMAAHAKFFKANGGKKNADQLKVNYKMVAEWVRSIIEIYNVKDHFEVHCKRSKKDVKNVDFNKDVAVSKENPRTVKKEVYAVVFNRKEGDEVIEVRKDQYKSEEMLVRSLANMVYFATAKVKEYAADHKIEPQYEKKVATEAKTVKETVSNEKK